MFGLCVHTRNTSLLDVHSSVLSLTTTQFGSTKKHLKRVTDMKASFNLPLYQSKEMFCTPIALCVTDVKRLLPVPSSKTAIISANTVSNRISAPIVWYVSL